MKNFTKICLSLSLFFAVVVQAQDNTDDFDSPTTKGTILVGASSSLSYANTKQKVEVDGDEVSGGSNSNSISLDSSVGFFADDNLAVGAQVDFSLFNTGDFNSTTIIFSPFVRYYFTEGKIKPFIQAAAGLGSRSFTDEGSFGSDDDKQTNGVSTWGFDGGVAFFINTKVSVDLGVGYSSFRSKNDEGSFEVKDINNTIGFTAGFNLFF